MQLSTMTAWLNDLFAPLTVEPEDRFEIMRADKYMLAKLRKLGENAVEIDLLLEVDDKTGRLSRLDVGKLTKPHRNDLVVKLFWAGVPQKRIQRFTNLSQSMISNLLRSYE